VAARVLLQVLHDRDGLEYHVTEADREMLKPSGPPGGASPGRDPAGVLRN